MPRDPERSIFGSSFKACGSCTKKLCLERNPDMCKGVGTGEGDELITSCFGKCRYIHPLYCLGGWQFRTWGRTGRKQRHMTNNHAIRFLIVVLDVNGGGDRARLVQGSVHCVPVFDHHAWSSRVCGVAAIPQWPLAGELFPSFSRLRSFFLLSMFLSAR